METKTKVIIGLLGVFSIILPLWAITKGQTECEPVDCQPVDCQPVACKQVECEPTVVEKVVEKPVEKIVYQDSAETLALIEYHKATACAFTGMYPSMFDITKAYADEWGLGSTITSDMYDLEAIANEYMSQNCN